MTFGVTLKQHKNVYMESHFKITNEEQTGNKVKQLWCWLSEIDFHACEDKLRKELLFLFANYMIELSILYLSKGIW